MSSDDTMLKFKNILRSNKKAQAISEEFEDELAGFEDDNLLVTSDKVIDKEILDVCPPEPEYKYVFYPKKNINVYDLARIIAFTQLSITQEVFEKIPDDLKQHFTQFSEISE